MPLVNEKRYGDIAKQSRKGIALQWKRNFAYLVRSQPQNCDSLKTISKLKPKAVNSASLSEIVFGYIQPHNAFALFMICSELKPFLAFISQ